MRIKYVHLGGFFSENVAMFRSVQAFVCISKQTLHGILSTGCVVLNLGGNSKCSIGGSSGKDNGWRAVLRPSFGSIYYPWRECCSHW